jgi:tRNA-specific 2-thiouridylase
LYRSSLLAEDWVWGAITPQAQPMRVRAKVRYRQSEQWALAQPVENGRVLLRFEEPQRAITVGQAVVLYQGDIVLGGGTICQVPPES